MRRQVMRAKFHDMQIVVPGIGNLDKELPSLSKSYKCEMWLDSDYSGVLLTKINNVELFIPLANVQIGFLAPEEKTKVELKVVKAS